MCSVSDDWLRHVPTDFTDDSLRYNIIRNTDRLTDHVATTSLAAERTTNRPRMHPFYVSGRIRMKSVNYTMQRNRWKLLNRHWPATSNSMRRVNRPLDIDVMSLTSDTVRPRKDQPLIDNTRSPSCSKPLLYTNIAKTRRQSELALSNTHHRTRHVSRLSREANLAACVRHRSRADGTRWFHKTTLAPVRIFKRRMARSRWHR